MTLRPQDTQAIQSVAVIGGLLGLIPILIWGATIFLIREGFQLNTSVLFAAVIIPSPYVLTIAMSRVGDHAARGGILLALGLLSTGVSLLLYFLLLPATAAILYASAWSIRAGRDRPLRVALFFAAGLFIASSLVLSFYAFGTVRG